MLRKIFKEAMFNSLMKILSLFIILFVSLIFLSACSDKENKNPAVPAVEPDTDIIPEAPSSPDPEEEVQGSSVQSWCLPSTETYDTMTFTTLGLIEGYLIEGKAYTVCEETIVDSGKLNSHKWRTQDNKVIKENRLDTDDKYALTTNWVNEDGMKCLRIEKEGIDPFLQC